VVKIRIVAGNCSQSIERQFFENKILMCIKVKGKHDWAQMQMQNIRYLVTQGHYVDDMYMSPPSEPHAAIRSTNSVHFDPKLA
jgi:hypothetical protein